MSELRFRRRCALWRPESATAIINNHYQVRRASRSALELCSWLHFPCRVPFPAPHAHFSLFARADIWWTGRSRARAARYECDGRAGPCATASAACARLACVLHRQESGSTPVPWTTPTMAARERRWLSRGTAVAGSRCVRVARGASGRLARTVCMYMWLASMCASPSGAHRSSHEHGA